VRSRRERGKTGNGFENLIFTPRYILWTGHLRDGCGHAAAVEKGKRRAQRAGRIGKGRRGPSGRWKLSQRPSVELVSRVRVCSERKILLAGCWWLICCERKVLLAGA
jgi:hypothetical protein